MLAFNKKKNARIVDGIKKVYNKSLFLSNCWATTAITHIGRYIIYFPKRSALATYTLVFCSLGTVYMLKYLDNKDNVNISVGRQDTGPGELEFFTKGS